MALITYQQTDTASDLTNPVSVSGYTNNAAYASLRMAQGGTAGTSARTITAALNTTERFATMITPSGVPGQSPWPNAAWTATVEITTANMSLTNAGTLWTGRISSSGTAQYDTILPSSIVFDLATTGVKTMTATAAGQSSPGWSSPTTDRASFELAVANTSTMSTFAFAWKASQTVASPFLAPVVPAAASVTTSLKTPALQTFPIKPAAASVSTSLKTPKTTYKIGVLSGSNAGASYANFASGNSTSLGSSYTLDWTYGIPVVGRTYLVFFTSSGSPGTVSMSDNAGNTWVGTVSDLAMIWRTTVTATLPAGSTWQITVDAGNTQSRINLGIVDFGAGSAFVNTMPQNTAVSASSATYDVSLMAPKYAGRTVLANLYDVNSISASLLTYPSGNVYLNTTGSVPFSAQAWAISDVPPITFNATQSANTFYRFIGSLYRFGVGAVASTPTVKSTLKPAAASLTTTRSTPTITNGGRVTTLAPAKASLTASPQTPTLKTSIKPAAASLTATGQTPVVTVTSGDVTVTPAARSLTATGQTTTLKVSMSPAAGSLTTSLKTPTLISTLKPNAGNLTVTGQTPITTLVEKPASGALTLAGQTPTITQTLHPAAGTLSMVGRTPTLALAIKPAAGSLAATGQTPAVILATVLTPAAASLTVTGQTDTLKLTVNPAAGALALTGQTPTLKVTIHPAAGSLTLTGQTPVVSITTFITPAAGALTTTRFAPTLASVIRPAAGALTLTGQTPVIILSKILQPAAGSLTLTVLTPSLAAAIRPTRGTLALVGRTPALKSIVRPTAGTLVVTGQQVGFAGAIAIAETSTSVRLAYASTNSTLSETSTGVALRNRATRAMITEEVI